jgi:hypothetical protein
MGDTEEQSRRALEGVRSLGRSAVRFSGSLVAMPGLVGWDDLRATVRFLAANGAEAVRVIVAAWSSRADGCLSPDEATIFADVRRFVAEMTAAVECPVLMEPSCPPDLSAVASGVVAGSSAWRAGVRAGDLFVEIGGERPFSRVHAWRLLSRPGVVRAVVERDGRSERVSWSNDDDGVPGVTMEYDFDPERAETVRRLVTGAEGRSLLLASELGHPAVCAVLRSLGIGDDAAEVVAVENVTFGGTIRAAGLLTVDDFTPALAARRQCRDGPVTQVLVPLESFDFRGLDLKRVHFSEIARVAGVPVLLA